MLFDTDSLVTLEELKSSIKIKYLLFLVMYTYIISLIIWKEYKQPSDDKKVFFSNGQWLESLEGFSAFPCVI